MNDLGQMFCVISLYIFWWQLLTHVKSVRESVTQCIANHDHYLLSWFSVVKMLMSLNLFFFLAISAESF